MSTTIIPDMVKETIIKPNSILNCDNIGLTMYTKQFKGLGTLLVMAKREDNGVYDVRCWDWLKSFKFQL